MNNNTKIIGVGGFARSGKDTFVKIASSILNRNGYNTKKFAFADGLKIDLDPWLKDIYGISAWTSNEDEKKLIRPFMVAHGCGKRIQTEGKYWVDMVERQIRDYINTVDAEKTVCFVSDVRFSNEANWLHDKNGWLVHLKKYTVEKDTEFKFNYEDHPELDGVEHPEQYVDDYIEAEFTFKKYDAAPNEEEEKQDPLVQCRADYKLELENVIEREKRIGNTITTESLETNKYLIDEISKSLNECPFLDILI